MGVGGTVDVKGLKISMTPAVHTSSIEEDGKVHYVGLATGFVVRMEDDRADLFRRRHGALRRHAAHPRAVRAGDRVPADRGSLHDGSRGRGEGL